jgi:excisionase family DNA binding protein
MADSLDDLEMIGIQEMSERFHISKRTLQHLLKTGRLHGVKIGRQWRVRVSDVRAFLSGDEDRDDARALEEALADRERIPHEQVRRELGL